MRTKSILTMWESGFVNRWHTHPDPRLRNAQDTTAAHSQRVLTLLILLFTVDAIDSHQAARVWQSALWHDADEWFIGDVSHPAKRALHTMRTALAEGADVFWKDHVGLPAPQITPEIEICDRLDSYLFVGRHAPDLLGTPEWQRMRKHIVELCGDSPAAAVAASLMAAVRGSSVGRLAVEVMSPPAAADR